MLWAEVIVIAANEEAAKTAKTATVVKIFFAVFINFILYAFFRFKNIAFNNIGKNLPFKERYIRQ